MFGPLFIIVLAILYFVPLGVAAYRHTKARGGILIVNLLLGWTFIGWVVALAWAVTGETDEDHAALRGPNRTRSPL